MATKFYGSQIGSKTTSPLSYTGSPAKLLRSDILSAFGFYLFLPFIVWPVSPLKSGTLCELYPSRENLGSIFLHLILIIMQVPFVFSIPFWVLFPLWSVLLGAGVFWAINEGICYILNGSKMRIPSNPKYASKEGHENEQWIFLNGVAVGKTWLQANVDRLALTFGRPVLGVHNKTNGIIFDVIQCLIQRNFNYATNDIRDCYQVVKETLYDDSLTKVVFILHSQGGIEGGMIIDWLLQEVPQDLLAKLEVYTFGCAANHFNNPHLHLVAQNAALKNPSTPFTTKTNTSLHYHDPLPTALNGDGKVTRRTSNQQSYSGKTIRYIEHYAHTSDFVARWGVLHYASTLTSKDSPSAPRYMGRVFERPGMGHQLCQHYLDNMFPLSPCPPDPSSKPASSNPLLFWKKSNKVLGGIGQSGYLGADETGNEFMNSILEMGHTDEKDDERESLETSYMGTHGTPLEGSEEGVLLRDMSPVGSSLGEFGVGKGFTTSSSEKGANEDEMAGFRVKDLSRLWLYVNGKSPKFDDVDIGISRITTL